MYSLSVLEIALIVTLHPSASTSEYPTPLLEPTIAPIPTILAFLVTPVAFIILTPEILILLNLELANDEPSIATLPNTPPI